MKNSCLLFFFYLFSVSIFSQIRGKITDYQNRPMPYVSIYLENSLSGTTSNDDGNYELSIKKTGKHTIVFQFLGYKTVKKSVEISSFPFKLNAKLIPEEVILEEVLVSTEKNPADRIIRQVIKNKEQNTNKSGKFTADFYSRGLFKVKNAPEKILGRKIGELGGGLDSTRSGIVYLSETVSKITFQKKPKKFKERIIASKVSGEDNGIAFNRASEVNFNLYKNLVPIANKELFSPIADYAFNYYKYKLEGSFYDKNGKLINKIKLIPRRKNDRVFGGYIYIVEDDWAVYGSELTITGEQINNPAITLLNIKQNYNYHPKNKIWVLILQTIDFKIGLLGFHMNGRFSASYSNYNFQPVFHKRTFTNEVLSFEKGATKKDSVYWNKLRPVPLTIEETKDYIIKDSIKTLKKSEIYLDSIDAKNNSFKILSPILGYTYDNSYKKWQFNYEGLLKNMGFNTVKGFNASANFNYLKTYDKRGRWWNIGTKIDYGLSEKKLRPYFYFNKKWNDINRPHLHIATGIETPQFDERKPISNLNNTIYSLIEKQNYAKYYEKTFARIQYSQEIFNGVNLYNTFEYANRKPLFNSTDFSFFNRKRIYRTNNPINYLSTIAPFTNHSVFLINIATQIKFGNTYLSYPDAKYSISNKKYPTLLLGYRKIIGLNKRNAHSDLVYSRLQQDFSLGNFGKFQYNIRGGLFLKQKNIPFMDYYHPMGNETVISHQNRMSSFYIMPYYKLSTNKKYAEFHSAHHFNGFLLSKIPLINKLNFHTVVGAKSYFSENNQPYSEFSVGLDNIGWGKWRFLRVDYVRSNFNGKIDNGIVFGIKLFD